MDITQRKLFTSLWWNNAIWTGKISSNGAAKTIFTKCSLPTKSFNSLCSSSDFCGHKHNYVTVAKHNWLYCWIGLLPPHFQKKNENKIRKCRIATKRNACATHHQSRFTKPIFFHPKCGTILITNYLFSDLYGCCRSADTTNSWRPDQNPPLKFHAHDDEEEKNSSSSHKKSEEMESAVVSDSRVFCASRLALWLSTVVLGVRSIERE